MEKNMKWGVNQMTPSILFKQIGLGLVGGAIFGVIFAFFAWLTEPGPELIVGIKQTWWYFALIGSVMQPIAYRYDSYEGMRHMMNYFFPKIKNYDF